MSRYGFEESIRDGATLPLHFEPRLVELHIDKAAIDAAYADLTGGLSDLDRETLSKAAARMAVLVKVPERIDKICADIANHYIEKVRPNGFKAMIVAFDQEACLLYKEQLDKYLPPEASEIVISVSGKEREDKRYRALKRDRDAEEKLLDRFRDPNDPLQILIVTAGKGVVATEKEEKAVTVGDIVLIPAGEKHWHGSNGDSEFSHIFVVRREDKVKQLED